MPVAAFPEKRMHFVREKRDKPPGRRFHAEKRLSKKRDKREKMSSSGFRRFTHSRYLSIQIDGEPLKFGGKYAPYAP
jgi:predicted esterase